MSFTQAAKSFFSKYADFSSRSSRSEYWYAYLFILLVSAGLAFVEGLLFLFPESEDSILVLIFQVGIIIPSVAIVVRRLHDTNRSGWWYLIVFTIIGIIPIFYWLCKAGDDGENNYGSNPLTN
tara:strand:- start:165 stop:533 length:369 start_codon:yes stop_codon:yes gene_type:complete